MQIDWHSYIQRAARDRATDQLVKYFYCKPEDLTWIPRTYVKIIGVVRYACNLSTRALETGRSWDLTL